MAAKLKIEKMEMKFKEKSSPGHLKKFLFLVMWPPWIQDGADGHNFERGPPKDHFSKVWLRLAL
jgi:hypothetical protein